MLYKVRSKTKPALCGLFVARVVAKKVAIFFAKYHTIR
uniref:Uncharacterized protein n=1 Tax=Myoviridae sp. ctRci5 TaxID=2825105 RepID=A0A8S5V6D1_9CAUD|nr:MAG TPA: hypothetical protein [Myoviridae sp. ctRci5]